MATDDKIKIKKIIFVAALLVTSASLSEPVRDAN